MSASLGLYRERLGLTRTISVWHVTPYSAENGSRLIDVGDAASVKQALARALPHVVNKGDMLVVVDQDQGRRTHVVHQFLIRQRSKPRYVPVPGAAHTRPVYDLWPDPLPAFPVDMIGLTPVFDALRDCPVGHDATLVEGG